MLKTAQTIDLMSYFDRTVAASGYVEDRKRNVMRRYDAIFTGQADSNLITIDETLYYTDGEKEQRAWQLTQQAPNLYTVTADFIVGSGTVEVADNRARWRYHGLVPFKNGQIKLFFDDLMVLTNNSNLVSSIVVSKFGFVCARSQTFYQPQAV